MENALQNSEHRREVEKTIAKIDDIVLARSSYYPDGNLKKFARENLRALGRRLNQLDPPNGFEMSYHGGR